MNRIEDEWHRQDPLIAGRMFEDEYDLARAIMNGAHGLKGGYAWSV